MSWAGLLAPGMAVTASATESDRFGLSVSRLHVASRDNGPQIGLSGCATLLRSAAEDVLSCFATPPIGSRSPRRPRPADVLCCLPAR